MPTRQSRLLLLIDDDPAQGRLVSALAAREGWRTQIVATVRDEDARFLGLSSLSGAHGHLFPTICQLLRDEGLDDVVVFGGGIIPDADRPALHDAGMRAIFGPGTSTEAISAFVAEASSRDDAGVGAEGGWIWEA